MGARVNLWRASSGRVILAFTEDERLEEFFARVPLPSGTSKDKLREELSDIRKRGYEITDSFVLRGIVNIAAPILDHTGRAIAALTMPHLERYEDPISFDDCARNVVAEAHRLTRSLGGPTMPDYPSG
jgi:DNA-binding IclR family transcriptional regulator